MPEKSMLANGTQSESISKLEKLNLETGALASQLGEIVRGKTEAPRPGQISRVEKASERDISIKLAENLRELVGMWVASGRNQNSNMIKAVNEGTEDVSGRELPILKAVVGMMHTSDWAYRRMDSMAERKYIKGFRERYERMNEQERAKKTTALIADYDSFQPLILRLKQFVRE